MVLAEAISAKVDELAKRFPTWRQVQAVRLYLLCVITERSPESVAQSINLSRRAVPWKNRNWGEDLVKSAIKSQLITMEEMRAWLKNVQDCHRA